MTPDEVKQRMREFRQQEFQERKKALEPHRKKWKAVYELLQQECPHNYRHIESEFFSGYICFYCDHYK